MSVTIRKAFFDDIQQLQALIPASVRGLSNAYYSAQQIESAIKYIFGIDTQLILDETYYTAQIGDIIVGCGGWSKRATLFGGDQHKSTEDPLLDPLTDAAKIRAFFVHPDYARRGIGREIITVCENAAQSAGFTCLELGATLPGVPLYTAMGYQEIERIDVPLPDGELLGIVKMRKYI